MIQAAHCEKLICVAYNETRNETLLCTTMQVPAKPGSFMHTRHGWRAPARSALSGAAAQASASSTCERASTQRPRDQERSTLSMPSSGCQHHMSTCMYRLRLCARPWVPSQVMHIISGREPCSMAVSAGQHTSALSLVLMPTTSFLSASRSRSKSRQCFPSSCTLSLHIRLTEGQHRSV